MKSQKKIRYSTGRVNRRAISVVSGFDDPDYSRYWYSQTPQARLRYMEELRRINYGNLVTKPMKRMLEIVERKNIAD